MAAACALPSLVRARTAILARMQSLNAAIAYAVGRKRVPVHLADPPVNTLALALTLGLRPPVSFVKLIDTLTLPGNFMPGQPLAASPEVSSITADYWADV